MSTSNERTTQVAIERTLTVQLAPNFPVWTCSHCKGIMSLNVGDVLHGDGWFHGACWEGIQIESGKE